MRGRTDLAVDIFDSLEEEKKKPQKREEKGNITITTIEIQTKEEEDAYGKPKGIYITVEFPSLFKLTEEEKLQETIKEALQTLIKEKDGTILVVGLGNTDITADSIGPKTASRIFATRHIMGNFAKNMGLSDLKSVSVMAPGVLGKTGIETGEVIKGVIEAVKPSAVIAIDALASSSVYRLFQTVQLCNSGISPGSGVKNSRKELSQKTLGVPVIAIGIPTVVDADVLAAELTGSQSQSDTDLVVTPKDADLLTDRITDIVSLSLNYFLQPDLDPDLLKAFL